MENDKNSTSRFIRDAVRALKPPREAIPAVRSITGWIVEQVKATCSTNANRISRSDLADDLECLATIMNSAGRILAKPAVRRALETVHQESTDSPDVPDPEKNAAINFFWMTPAENENPLPALLNQDGAGELFSGIAATAHKAVGALHLRRGPGRNSGAGVWRAIDLPPKTLLAVLGARLYCLIHDKPFPSETNDQVMKFLANAWYAISDERPDSGDWTHAIREAAQMQRHSKPRAKAEAAHLGAVLLIGDLEEKWKQLTHKK